MPATRAKPRYYSISDAAEILGVTVKTIQRWIADGTIPAHRIGTKVVRISEDSLNAALRPIPSGGGPRDAA